MSNDHEREPEGPLMLCATSVLKPGPTRVGKLGANITLPRTVAWTVLVAGAAGALVGMLVAMTLLGGGLQRLLMSGVLCGAVGVVLVTYEPTPGEKLLKVIGLEVLSRRRRVTVEGVTAQAYIGICPITHLEGGVIRIQRGAANVPAGSVDEHGSFVGGPVVTPGGLLSQVGVKSSREVGRSALPTVLPDHDPTEAPAWAAKKNIRPSGPPPGWGADAGELDPADGPHPGSVPANETQISGVSAAAAAQPRPAAPAASPAQTAPAAPAAQQPAARPPAAPAPAAQPPRPAAPVPPPGAARPAAAPDQPAQRPPHAQWGAAPAPGTPSERGRPPAPPAGQRPQPGSPGHRAGSGQQP